MSFYDLIQIYFSNVSSCHSTFEHFYLGYATEEHKPFNISPKHRAQVNELPEEITGAQC